MSETIAPEPKRGPWPGSSGGGGAPPPSAPDHRLRGDYRGRRSDLFALALKTALLTAITLGVYRFWERTRIRRHIWSATVPGGDAFEYTGTSKEKFLGFLIALVVLGVGLGLLQLGLFFVNLSLFSPAQTPEGEIAQLLLFQVSFLLVLPLYFFAKYRAYRYRMSRTRWRGIRFGVLPGAWGYAWRHLMYLALAIVSGGVLWPLMTFRLEAYRTNRTFFGDAQWHQGGRWTMLYPGDEPHGHRGGAFRAGGAVAGASARGLGLGLHLARYGLVLVWICALPGARLCDPDNLESRGRGNPARG